MADCIQDEKLCEVFSRLRAAGVTDDHVSAYVKFETPEQRDHAIELLPQIWGSHEDESELAINLMFLAIYRDGDYGWHTDWIERKYRVCSYTDFLDICGFDRPDEPSAVFPAALADPSILFDF